MDCEKEVADILLARFNELQLAVKEDDLSKASFPLTGEFARLELLSKRDTMMWVLEMLNISDEPANHQESWIWDSHGPYCDGYCCMDNPNNKVYN